MILNVHIPFSWVKRVFSDIIWTRNPSSFEGEEGILIWGDKHLAGGVGVIEGLPL
jgi:hypothetical protein